MNLVLLNLHIQLSHSATVDCVATVVVWAKFAGIVSVMVATKEARACNHRGHFVCRHRWLSFGATVAAVFCANMRVMVAASVSRMLAAVVGAM